LLPPLLDSDVLIDYLRRVPGATTAIDSLLEVGNGAIASVVSKTEILSGMRPAEEEGTLSVLAGFEWVPITDPIATRAGSLARVHRGTHPGVGLADYLIGASAELLGTPLWTQNPRHFPMFEGLEPPYQR
jgi:predicted nucleic acid-binding protein